MVYFVKLLPALSREYFSDCIIKPQLAEIIMIGAVESELTLFIRVDIFFNGILS